MGVDWPSADPRLAPAAALSFLASPLDADPFLYVQLPDHAELAEQYLEDTGDLADFVERRRERKALADSLGVCSLPVSALPVWSAEKLLTLLHALTGGDVDRMAGIGKRVLALEALLRGPPIVGLPAIPPRFLEAGLGWEEGALAGWFDQAQRIVNAMKLGQTERR
jgi:aldehyde:ferredoxin oxidoreductase